MTNLFRAKRNCFVTRDILPGIWKLKQSTPHLPACSATPTPPLQLLPSLPTAGAGLGWWGGGGGGGGEELLTAVGFSEGGREFSPTVGPDQQDIWALSSLKWKWILPLGKRWNLWMMDFLLAICDYPLSLKCLENIFSQPSLYALWTQSYRKRLSWVAKHFAHFYLWFMSMCFMSNYCVVLLGVEGYYLFHTLEMYCM